MKVFLESLSNPLFMPHGHCYLWQPDILWTHVIADSVITAAYYAIPIILAIILIKRKQSVPYANIISLFVAFIFLCGTTHLISIYVIWHPAYEIQGWIKAITALISIFTAIVLAPKLPEILRLQGIQKAYEESQRNLKRIREEKAEMQAIFDSSKDRETRVLQLKQEVNALLQSQGKPIKYLANEGGHV